MVISGLLEKVILGSIALAVLFLLLNTIVVPNLNDTMQGNITGISNTTWQGILLLVMVLALIGFAMAYMPRKT